ncbi:MAG: glycosyltransferase family 4 protein [Verrucomicrobia bacterium]|nr:glycosyltransferase family 4 protein [Verrucomicrobiota bacterium]
MRVLYFSNGYTVHDRRFLLKMAESSLQVWFMPMSASGLSLAAHPLPPGIEYIRPAHDGGQAVPASDRIRWVGHLDQVVNEMRPDIVHAGPIQTCGFIAALVHPRRLVLMSWGSDILEEATRDDESLWITRFALKRAHRIVCDCEAVRNAVCELISCPNERFTVFPWGVDFRKFCPGPDTTSLRSQLGWEKNFVILATRNWESVYGIEILLDAFDRAYARNAKIRLLLLGDGSLRSVVNDFVIARGLEKAVCRPGLVDPATLPNYYRCADLYLCCSRADGTSISLLEGMSTGLPAAVSNVGGNGEWIQNGCNGWLVPCNDAEQMSDSILLATSQSAHARQNMANRNRQIIKERADWDRNFAKLLLTYEQLMRDNREGTSKNAFAQSAEELE